MLDYRIGDIPHVSRRRSGRVIADGLSTFVPEGWTFQGLVNTGGGCMAYYYAHKDEDGELDRVITIVGDDILTDGDRWDFENCVRGLLEVRTSDGWSSVGDDEGFTIRDEDGPLWSDDEVIARVREMVGMLTVSPFVSWGVWDGFGFDCEDPDDIQQHECSLVGVYPSEEIAIGEADRHYEALIANNPNWQSFFVLVRSSDEWEVK